MRTPVRYNRCVAPGELCSASWCALSLPLSQSNIFLFVQMHSGLANALKTESLKQSHLDTQLTHSLLISSYIIFFCTCCGYAPHAYSRRAGCLISSETHVFVWGRRHTIRYSEEQLMTHGDAAVFHVHILISYKKGSWVQESIYSKVQE